MADPRNPSFEDVPSDAYLDPRSFVEAIQEQQEKELTNVQEDRGLFGFATLILAGIGGYAALKHFPPGRIAAVAGEVKNLLTNPKSYGASSPQLDKIRGALNKMSQVVLKQPWAHANQEKFGTVLGSIRAANDPEFLQGIRTIGELARKNPKNFANVASIQSVVKSHLKGPIPQDGSFYRSLTLGDLFDPSNATFRSKLWGGLSMPEPLAELQNVLKGVAGNKITGILEHARLDPGLYIRRGTGNVIDLVDHRWRQPGNWIRGLQRTADNIELGKWSNWPGNMSRKTALAGAAFGLYAGYDKDDPVSTVAGTLAGLALGSIPVRHLARAGRWATELLLPTELLAKGPDIAAVSAGMIHKYSQAKLTNVSGGIVAFGNLIPIFGVHKPQMGGIIAEGLKVGRTQTAMGRTAATAAKESFITRRLAKQRISRADEYITEREAVTGKPMNPIKALLVRLGDTIGVGPQYNRGIGDFVDPDVIPTGQPLPSMLQGLFMDPAKTIRSAVSGFFKNLSGKEAATKTGAADYYVFRPNEGLKDFANFQLNRVGHLFEQTLGFGIKFGATPGETAKRWLGISIGAMAGIEALRYTDYAMRQTIGTGPISAPLQAYAAIRNVEQHVLAATGIQPAAEYLENLMPGLVSSPLSMLARTAAAFRFFRGQAPFGFLGASKLGEAAAKAANLEARFGLKGRAAAGLLAATQLTDIAESPVHLAAVYRGEVDVPVREGRGWLAGTTPYGGGRVTHTRPHLIPTLLSHAREIGVYGSEKSYWQAQLGLPVPEAWFGLRPLLFPYAPEQHAVEQGRAVAATGPMVGLAGNLPLIGPTINATLGELLKPTQYWQKDQWADTELTNIAQRLGFDPLKGQRSLTDPTSLISSLQRQIDVLRDFLGMPGFMLGAAKRMVTGESDFYAPNRELETFGQATSWERAYYDMQLGGLGGFSELPRRMLPHRRHETLLVNPLPNRLAEQQWLPGKSSSFPRDRNSYTDFTRGDPYSRLISGEARLPGPGREALVRLHSGIPGVYSPYDRWLVLRDIAPTSQAFRHYDALVKSWAAVSSKGPHDGDPFRRSFNGIVREVLDGDTVVVDIDGKLTTVRIEGGDTPEHAAGRHLKAVDPTRIQEAERAKRHLEKAVLNRTANIQVSNVDPYGRLVGKVTATGSLGRGIDVSAALKEAYPGYELSRLQQTQVESSRQYLRERFAPGKITERVFKDPFADVPRNMRDLTSRSVTAINRAIKEEGAFTIPEKVLGNIWEKVSHVNLPGPLNWPFNKFFAQRDALELYRRNTLMGGSFAQWETPISSYAIPWAHQTIGFFNKDYIPGRVRAQRAALAQVDALEYVRNKQFANYAASIGDTEAAAQFSDRRNRTAANVILTGNRRFAHSALARSERGFYDYFASETDPSLRGSIIRDVSPQMGSVLQMAWGNAPKAILERQRALIAGVETPKMAMHPDITANMLKVRVSHDHAWDFHEISMSLRDNYVTEDVFSDAFEIPGPPQHFSSFVHTKSQGIANRIGLQNHTITTEDSLMGPAVNARISRDPRKYRHLMQNYGPASQGMRF